MLSDVFAFPRVDGPAGTAVAVPAAQCDTDPRLTWCAAYWDPRSQGDTFLVPLRAWTSHDDLLGMDAPELSARHLLDYAAVAQIAGCSPRTVANYLAKALMPQPVARLGGSPVWPRPLIQHWLDTRTDAPATRSARAATRPARARPTAEPRHDDEVLEIDEEEDFWLQLLDRQDR